MCKLVNLEKFILCTVLLCHVLRDTRLAGNETDIISKASYGKLDDIFQLVSYILLWQRHLAIISKNLLADKACNPTSPPILLCSQLASSTYGSHHLERTEKLKCLFNGK